MADLESWQRNNIFFYDIKKLVNMKTLERIMLVDDDADTNFYNTIMLNRTNASNDIVVFQNGKDALLYLEKENQNVDLIFLDINMPVMNGWQFLEQYGKLDASRRATIMVVMLTSSVNYDDKKKAEKLHLVNRYINKPLTPQIIKEILELFEE